MPEKYHPTAGDEDWFEGLDEHEMRAAQAFTRLSRYPNRRAVVPVEVPYEGDQQLVIDPHTAEDTWLDAYSNLTWLINQPNLDKEPDEDDELERVMRAATILFAAGAGTFPACLHTAIIWERG